MARRPRVEVPGALYHVIVRGNERNEASQARAIVGHLGKTYAGIPYARTAKYFHRDASTLTRDIRRFETALHDSAELRRRVSGLVARL